MVRDFAEREIAPNVMKWDEPGTFPLETVKELGKLGLMGIIFPTEYSGAGMGYVEYVIAIEELSRVDGSVGIIVAAHTSLCSNHIFIAGNEEQKRKYIPKLATGEFIGAWGLTEPGSGSDAGGARCTAVRKGNKWVMNGTKTFITNGALCGRGGRDRGHRQDRAHAWIIGFRRRQGDARDFASARKKTSWACAPAIPRS